MPTEAFLLQSDVYPHESAMLGLSKRGELAAGQEPARRHRLQGRL